MKAFGIDGYKSKEGLRALDVPEPALGERDVLVEIHAASVNPLDSKVASGEFKMLLPYAMPLVLGHDLAGVVAATGPRATRFKIGDEVYARPSDGRIGTFAERIAVAEDDLAIKPKSLTMEEAAALPLVALAAWQVLIEQARLRPGQKVLVQAGSGGVGTVAIQLAKHLGGFVATTTSTANVGWVKALGADVVVDYRNEDVSKVLRDYDVVLDSLGGAEQAKSVAVLRAGGQLIGISGPPDAAFAERRGLSWPLKLVMRLLSRGIRKKAAARGASYAFVFMRANGEQLGKIASLVDQGAIRPVVDKIFPFEQSRQAVDYAAQGRAKGKVVIRVKP